MMRPEAKLPAGQQSVREHNLTLVLAAVAARPDGLSRAQLASVTGLTRATAGALVDELIASGLVVESEPRRGPRGRPGSPLSLNPDGPAGLGIEINVDYVSACVVDLSGQLRVIEVESADNRAATALQAVRRAARLARSVATGSGLPIAGIAIALPGLVDGNAVLRRAPNLSRWADVDIAPMLRGDLGSWAAELTIDVENEANLAALAQLWYGGAGSGPDFLHVSGEIGIGAGIVLDGDLFRGVRGYAGEIGHVVVDPDGPPCHCGSRGCVEQLAGQEVLLGLAGCESMDELVLRAEARDPVALASLRRAGAALGLALVSTVNVLDIPTVVLGGIYARLAEWIVAPICEQLSVKTVSATWAPVDVLASTLGADAAVRGAAGTVVRAIVARAVRPARTTAVT
jgi:predicted NBD/HSP70 family sugar kinase